MHTKECLALAENISALHAERIITACFLKHTKNYPQADALLLFAALYLLRIVIKTLSIIQSVACGLYWLMLNTENPQSGKGLPTGK